MIGAIVFQENAFGFARRGRDHLGAEDLAEIDRGQTDTARRAMHEQPFAGLQAGTAHQPDIGRQIADGKARRFAITDTIRDLAQQRRRQLRFLGIATETAADDAVARLDLRHLASDGDDVARSLASGRKGHGGFVLILALYRQDVGEVDRGGTNAHARLVWLERRQLHLFQLQRRDIVADLAADDRLHAVPVLAAGWATWGSVRMPPRRSAVAKVAAAAGSRR